AAHSQSPTRTHTEDSALCPRGRGAQIADSARSSGCVGGWVVARRLTRSVVLRPLRIDRRRPSLTPGGSVRTPKTASPCGGQSEGLTVLGRRAQAWLGQNS